MATLTKKDIEFNGARFWRDLGNDGVMHWYVSVDYAVTTQEGEAWNRSETREIKGAIKTKAVNLLSDIRAFILTKEGL